MKVPFEFLLLVGALFALVHGQGVKRTRGGQRDISSTAPPPESEPLTEADYDDGDVQFENSPPNLLILLADPANGTTLPLNSTPNSDVVLDPTFGKVHLFCSAYYPVKWTYSGDGVSCF